MPESLAWRQGRGFKKTVQVEGAPIIHGLLFEAGFAVWLLTTD